MSKHIAKLEWKNNGPNFLKGQYSREHTWTFDGGITVAASPSPSVVPMPWSNPANVDPEEAFVAAIASCHMLTFLWLASKQEIEIESYSDGAVGEMTKNERGVFWVSVVDLHPQIVYGGEKRPTREEEAELHHRAHEECFIANSVKTEIRVVDAGGAA
jgi:organic hydroperoxide reductase OsmC/OhrA